MINRKALSPTVVRLGLVSLISDISSEMLYPITPIFLTSVLGASMFSVGLIEGVAEGISSFLKIYVGQWSDRIGKRRNFIFVGYLLSAISKPMIGAANSWGIVLGARAFDRVGKGVRTAPRDALLADSVHSSSLGAAFGWHRGMDTMGAVIGPILALVFISLTNEDMRSIFYWALIPGLLAAFLVLTVRDIQKINSDNHEESFSFKNITQLPAPFKVFLFAWAVFSVTNSTDAFLLLKAKATGADMMTTVLLYTFFNLTYALSSPYLGGLSDRLGPKRVLVGGLILFSLVYFGFAFAGVLWQFWILFGCYGLFMAATEGVGKSFAIQLMPKHLKATAIGLLGSITGLGAILGGGIAGILWDSIDSSAAFIFGAVGALTSVVILSWAKIQAPKVVL